MRDLLVALVAVGVFASFSQAWSEIPIFPPRVETYDVIVDEARLETGNWTGTCDTYDSTKLLEMFPRCISNKCQRYVEDDFLNSEEVKILLDMMQKGMISSESNVIEGGPTILDINSGFMKDADGVVNIYQTHRNTSKIIFSTKEYETYRNMFKRIISKIKQVFEIEELFFTAPTFVARIIGAENWEPKDMHDEYFHAHVDQMNTHHYFYSGLVYLSDYNADFSGGEFLFVDEPRDKEFKFSAVLPRKGRFITFKSGVENLHKVNKVLSGTRFTLSMWFTCDKERQFETFLDGKVHQEFKSKEDL